MHTDPGLDFQTFLLDRLMSDPQRWRLRRVDSYVSRDWSEVEQQTHIDVRLDTDLIREAFDELERAYSETGASSESLSDLRASLDDPHLPVRAVIPILWRYDPTLRSSAASIGEDVVPMSRLEAADLLARVFSAKLAVAEAEGLLDLPDRDALTLLAWCMAAADVASVREDPRLEGIARAGVTERTDVIASWLAGDLASFGFGPKESRAASRAQRSRLRRIVERSKASRTFWRLTGEEPVPELAEYDPAVHPLFLHHAYLEYLHSRTQSDTAPEAGDLAHRVTSAFLDMCETWLDIVEQLSADVTEREEHAPLAFALARATRRLAAASPFMARLDLHPDRIERLSIRQTVSTITSDEYWTLYDAADSSWGARALDRFFRRPAWSGADLWRRVWSAVAGGTLLPLFAGATQSFPIVLHDAQVYQLQVTSPTGELEIVPHSAYILSPRPPADDGGLRTRSSRMLVPLGRWPVRRFFGRVTDSNTREHHFHTTSTHRITFPGVTEEPAGSSLPYLVVPHRIRPLLLWTNRLLSYGVLVLAVLTLRSTFAEFAGIQEAALPVIATSKVLVPLILTVLLLLSFERMDDKVLTAEVRRYGWVAVAALIVLVAALVLRTALLQPSILPGLFGPDPYPATWIVDPARRYFLQETELIVAIVGLGAVYVALRKILIPLVWWLGLRVHRIVRGAGEREAAS